MTDSYRIWIAVAVTFCTGSQLLARTIPPDETERLELDFDTTDFRLRINFHNTTPTGQVQIDHVNSSSDLIAREILDFDGVILQGHHSLVFFLVEPDGRLFSVNDALAAETGSSIIPLDDLVAGGMYENEHIESVFFSCWSDGPGAICVDHFTHDIWASGPGGDVHVPGPQQLRPGPATALVISNDTASPITATVRPIPETQSVVLLLLGATMLLPFIVRTGRK